MKRRIFFNITFQFLFFLSLSFLIGKDENSFEPPKDTKEIYEKLIQALNGRESLINAKNWSYKAEINYTIIESSNPPKYFHLYEYYKPPKIRKDFEFTMPLKFGNRIFRSFHIFNGKTGWSNANDQQILMEYSEGKELSGVKEPWLPYFHYLLKIHDGEYKIELISQEKINDTDTYKIQIYRGEKKEKIYLFVDRNSYLPMKEIQGERYSSEYEDFRNINSVIIPFKYKTSYEDKQFWQKGEYKVLSLEYGAELKIEDGLFEYDKRNNKKRNP